jgi:hypothetical protein
MFLIPFIFVLGLLGSATAQIYSVTLSNTLVMPGQTTEIMLNGGLPPFTVGVIDSQGNPVFTIRKIAPNKFDPAKC